MLCKGNSQKQGDGLYFKAYINRRGFLEALKRAADSIPGFSLSGNSNLSLNHALEWYIAGYSDSMNIQDFPEFAKLNTYRMFAVDINYAFENDNDYVAKIRKKSEKHWTKQKSYLVEQLLITEI